MAISLMNTLSYTQEPIYSSKIDTYRAVRNYTYQVWRKHRITEIFSYTSPQYTYQTEVRKTLDTAYQ